MTCMCSGQKSMMVLLTNVGLERLRKLLGAEGSVQPGRVLALCLDALNNVEKKIQVTSEEEKEETPFDKV